MAALSPQSMTVSAAVAKIVAKDAPYAAKLAVARGETNLCDQDLVTVLYLLYCGGDRDIRAAAVGTLRQALPASLAKVAARDDFPPRILHFLAQVCGHEPLLFRALLDNPASPEETVLFLLERADRSLFSLIFDREIRWRPIPEAVRALLRNPHLTEEEQRALTPEEEPPLARTTAVTADLSSGKEEEEAPSAEEEAGEEDVEEDGEEDEEAVEEEEFPPPDADNYSKYQLALDMGVSEKIKMALTGDKEWRNIFLKDSNKLVNTAVLKNPRVTEGEVLAVTKNKTSSEELIRIILVNKEWMKISAVRSALVSHPKTPVASALRFMTNLTEKELKALGKSKSISQVVVSAARRILSEKAKKK